MMPLYEFACEKCKIKWEVNLTLSEHSAIKNSMRCECGNIGFQVVSPLNFRLKGEGWFGREGGNNAHGLGYELTQREMDKSKEDVARMDDYASNMSEKDEVRSEF